MVTLRPSHPHPIASARPANGLDGFAPVVRSVFSRSRQGRHRIRVAWNPYRSRHQDLGRTGAVRFLPSWRQVAPSSDPLESALPAPVDTAIVEVHAKPDPTPLARELAATDAVLEPTAVHPLTPARQPSPVQPNGSAPATEVIHAATPSAPVADIPVPAAAPILPAERPSHASTRVLHRSRLLPLAHPRDGSSLAALLGFGAKEAAFGGDWANGDRRIAPSDPVDDPWASFPSLSTVTTDLNRRGNTGDTVKLLWDATAELDLGRDLLPNDAAEARLLRSPRRIRWSLVISCALLAILMAATVKVISDLPGHAAEARQDQYAEAAGQLSGTLTPIEQSLHGGGLLSDSGLSVLTSRISSLDSAARTSSRLAFEQLPSAPIIGSDGSVDELMVPKQLLESASLQAIRVGERLDDAMSYSLALSTAFSLPALPGEASPTEVDRIAEQLSLSLAETRLGLTGLPDDPIFGTFRQEAFDTVSALETAQADYVASLRAGDTAAAAEAAISIEESVTIVRDRIRSPLEQVQTWALGQITEIRSTLSDLESLVDG